MYHYTVIINMDCGLRTADCGLRTADCGLRTADCARRTAHGALRTVDCELRTTDLGIKCGLSITDWVENADSGLNAACRLQSLFFH